MAIKFSVLDGGDNDAEFDFYNIEHPVFPIAANSIRTDVMLVQYLVNEFFFSPVPPLSVQVQFIQILQAATSRGQRFDDGIYGAHTRAAVKLCEDRKSVV